jgi:hypothetical protein
MTNNRYDDIMGLPLHMWYGIAVAAEVDGAWDRDDCRIRGILDTVSDIMETGGNGQEDGLIL